MAATMSLQGTTTAVATPAGTAKLESIAVAPDTGSHKHNGEEYYSRGLRARFRLDGLKVKDASQGKLAHEASADIEYEFNEGKYLARARARLAEGGLATELPKGWPLRLEGPMAWVGDDFRKADGSENDEKYVVVVNAEQKREVWAALLFFKGS